MGIINLTIPYRNIYWQDVWDVDSWDVDEWAKYLMQGIEINLSIANPTIEVLLPYKNFEKEVTLYVSHL